MDSLCKALGWYFPLMAKFKITSIEELIFRKFPYSCPYCRETPHRDAKCKNVKGTAKSVDHSALKAKYIEHHAKRPVGINDWQKMFNEIYPRDVEATARSIVGLFEEIGELAEAIRVFERYPKYLAGEAADVFSYLMGLANEYDLQIQQEGQPSFDLQSEYLQRFPGLCVQCGYPVCVCPLVPDSTVGRMAKELDLRADDHLFVASIEFFREQAIQVSKRVLDEIGGVEGLATRFPFDRGEANRALVLFCLEAARKIQDPKIAETFRSAALKTATSVTYAGSPRRPEDLSSMINSVSTLMQKGGLDAIGVSGPGSKPLTNSIGQIVVNVARRDINTTSNENVDNSIRMSTIYGRKWAELSENVSLDDLRRQISKAVSALEAESKSYNNEEAMRALAEAQSAAAKGNGPKVLEALAKGGSFLLDIATKVGADVLAKVLSQSMGLTGS